MARVSELGSNHQAVRHDGLLPIQPRAPALWAEVRQRTQPDREHLSMPRIHRRTHENAADCDRQ